MALTDLGDRLALIIDAKTSGAVSSIQKLTAEEKAAALQTEALTAKIADLEAIQAKRPLSNAQGLQLSRAKNDLAAVESTLASGVTPAAGRAERALSKLGLSGQVSGSALVSGFAKAGAAVAAFAGFEFLKSGIHDYIDLANQIRAVQLASGATAQDSSKLVAITNAFGVSAQTAALGVFRLGKNIALQPQHLTNMGIAIAKTKTGSTDLIGTLQNVAAAYQATADPAARAAIVYEAFGRAGTSLLPILAADKGKIAEVIAEEKKRGHIFDQTDLTNARNYQIAIRELKDSFTSFALDAGRFVVPMLTQLADQLTTIGDAAHSVGGIHLPSAAGGSVGGFAHKVFSYVTGIGAPSLLDFFGHHTSAADKAKAELAQQQDAAQKAALAQTYQAAVGTLAGPFDTLAGPAAVKASKQTLTSALQAVTNAKREQAAAVRALATAQGGGSVASSLSITAAEARVTAAEAAYKKAEYLGGTAGIASARAGVLSAQAALNRLRGQGAVNTTSLANAQDRLTRSNQALVTAQHKAKDAQKAVNAGTGLSKADVLKQITDQANSQHADAVAQSVLAVHGVTSEVLAKLDTLNTQSPGTLEKLAHNVHTGFVDKLNAEMANVDAAQALFGNAQDYAYAYNTGSAWGKSLLKGLRMSLTENDPTLLYKKVLGAGLPVGRRPAVASDLPHNLANMVSGGGIIVQGNLNVSGLAAREVVRKAISEARRMALSGMP